MCVYLYIIICIALSLIKVGPLVPMATGSGK